MLFSPLNSDLWHQISVKSKSFVMSKISRYIGTTVKKHCINQFNQKKTHLSILNQNGCTKPKCCKWIKAGSLAAALKAENRPKFHLVSTTFPFLFRTVRAHLLKLSS